MSESASESVEATTETTEAPSPQAQSVDSLPQWAQDHIKSLRDEAASNRVKARDSAEQARKVAEDNYNAQLAELNQQVEVAKTDAESAHTKFLRLNAVLEAGVPGERANDIADRVRGTTEEEIKADAARMKDLFGAQRTPYTDPTQGLGKTGSANPADQFGEFILGHLS